MQHSIQSKLSPRERRSYHYNRILITPCYVSNTKLTQLIKMICCKLNINYAVHVTVRDLVANFGNI